MPNEQRQHRKGRMRRARQNELCDTVTGYKQHDHLPKKCRCSPPSAVDSDRSAQLLDLPDELLQRVTEQLPPNDVPCSLRLVCRELASRLRSPRHTAIHVGKHQQCDRLASRTLIPAPLLLHRWAAPGAGRCLTFKHKQQLLCCAARCGSVELLQQLERALGCCVPKEAVWSAAEEGHGHVCQWLREQALPWPSAREDVEWDDDALAEYRAWGKVAREGAACAGQAALYDSLVEQKELECWEWEEQWDDCDLRLEYPLAAMGGGHQRVVELVLRQVGARAGGGAGAGAGGGGSGSGSGGSSSWAEGLRDAAHGCLWAVRINDYDTFEWMMECVAAAERRKEGQGGAGAGAGSGAGQERLYGPPIAQYALMGYAAYGCDLPTLRRVHEICEQLDRQLAQEGRRPQDTAHSVPDDEDLRLDLELLDWAVAGAMVSPTPDWRAKVGWLVSELGYPRGPEELVARLAAARRAARAAEAAAVAAAAAAAAITVGGSGGNGGNGGGGEGRGAGWRLATQGTLQEQEGGAAGDEAGWRFGWNGEAAREQADKMGRMGRWLAAQPDAAERYRWLVGQGLKLGGGGMLEEAVRCGATDLVEELLGGEGGSSSGSGNSGVGGREGEVFGAEGVPEAAVEAAAGAGHVGVLRALYDRGRRMGMGVLHAAAAGGHLEAVEWLLRVLSCGGAGGAGGSVDLAAAAGRPGRKKQGTRLGALLTPKLLTLAAGSGSRRLVVWLRGLGCPWGEGALAAAAEGGSEELVEWMVRRGGCPMGVSGGRAGPCVCGLQLPAHPCNACNSRNEQAQCPLPNAA